MCKIEDCLWKSVSLHNKNCEKLFYCYFFQKLFMLNINIYGDVANVMEIIVNLNPQLQKSPNPESNEENKDIDIND